MKAAVVYSRLPEGRLAPDDDRFEEFDAPDVPAAVAAALERLGYAARAIEDDTRLVGRLRRERPDFVVNLAEGRSGRGREAIVPVDLRAPRAPLHGIRRAHAGRQPRQGRRQAPGLALRRGRAGRLVRPGEALPEVAFPAIVKPVCEGSSKGIRDGASVVRGSPARSPSRCGA